MSSVTTNGSDEIAMLKNLLKETREQFANAIHWEDMHPIMRRIDTELAGSPDADPSSKDIAPQDAFEFVATQLEFSIEKNETPFPYLYKCRETHILSTGWNFAIEHMKPEEDIMSQQLIEAGKKLLAYAERNTCTHEETYRGGAIWEICSSCDVKWADDRGGRPEYVEPPEFQAMRDAIDQAAAKA